MSKVTRAYDAAGRLLSDTQDIKAGTFPPHTVNYTYRADGKVTGIKLDTAQDYEFLFGYDGMARLKTIKYVLNTSTDYEYYYDAASNVTKRFNWLSSGTNVAYTYDNLNRVSQRDINVPTGQIPRGWFSKEHYTYDAMNRLTKVLRDEDVKSDIFTYYLDGELFTATYGTMPKVTYNLDNSGNRTSVVNGISAGTYLTNNLNQYTKVGINTALYANAHALSSYLGESYFYIGGTFLAKATVGTNTLLLYYDALGRCVQRSVNGITTYRIFDGDHFIMEYNSGNAFLGNALYGRGIDEVIARSNNNQGQFSFPDRNGNVSVVLGFLGETLESYRYDAFGMPTFYSGAGTLITQSGISNSLLYTGREWNHTFGLYEYRARGYEPKLGRFLSEDPLGFDAGDYNLYRYVANDPLDKTDPMGLYRVDENGNLQPETTREFVQMGNAIEHGNTMDTTPAIDPIDILSFGIAKLAASALGRVATSAITRETAISGLGKAEMKLAAAKLGLPEAQAAGVKSAITRATSKSAINVTQSGANVTVKVSRPGKDGYQVMESVISPDGSKTVVQKAYNASGDLVHLEVKTARSN